MKLRALARSWHCRGLLLLLLAALSWPLPVWAWGSATHAHVADRLGAGQGAANLNEIYGAMALDTFNYLFGSPYQSRLHDLAHHQAMRVWHQAQGGDGLTRSVAYGFVSHNDDWGADYTAHHRGLTYGLTNGYVIAKTAELMASSTLLPMLGLPAPVANELTHIVVETGVDVLILALNPTIGQKIMDSTQARTAAFPQLMVQAYAPDLALPAADAAALITEAETRFQASMYDYGLALTFPPDTAVSLLAGQFAALADTYLRSYGISLPMTNDQIALFLAGFINEAMVLCQDDFAAELEQTVGFVDAQLRQHGVTPVPVPAAALLLTPALLTLARQLRRRS